MSWYVCKRCEYIAKQKEVMKRHLNKQKKCQIKNNNNTFSDIELYNMSLEKRTLDTTVVNNKMDNYCYNCSKQYANSYSYKRHLHSGACVNKGGQNINNSVNTINNSNTNINCNNYININVNFNTLKGFREKWDVSKIDKYQMMGLLLSNKKFSNTLEKILENDNNLNVIIGDDAGIIYNSDSDKYEPISKNELFKLTMDKIYGHLKDFYDSIIEDTDKNKFFNKDTTLLNSEMDSINTNYNRYYYKSPYFRSNADEAIEYLYNVIKKEAEKIFIEKNEKQPNNITM